MQALLLAALLFYCRCVSGNKFATIQTSGENNQNGRASKPNEQPASAAPGILWASQLACWRVPIGWPMN